MSSSNKRRKTAITEAGEVFEKAIQSTEDIAKCKNIQSKLRSLLHQADNKVESLEHGQKQNGLKYKGKDATQCKQCDNTVDPDGDYAATCAMCKKKIEKDDWSNHDDSDEGDKEILCVDCMTTCQICEEMVCGECVKACECCYDSYCIDCEDSCEICHSENICSNCTTTFGYHGGTCCKNCADEIVNPY